MDSFLNSLELEPYKYNYKVYKGNLLGGTYNLLGNKGKVLGLYNIVIVSKGINTPIPLPFNVVQLKNLINSSPLFPVKPCILRKIAYLKVIRRLRL
jgi:hypothetical protein